MGTSASRRSPERSLRWRAVRAALVGPIPAERAVAVMFVAARSEVWLEYLTSPALIAYARAADEASAALAGSSPNESDVVSRLVAGARDQGLAAGGGGLALPLAERALARILLQQARSPAAADAPASAQLLVETVRQLALHLAARDMPDAARLASLPISTARERTREIGNAAATVAEPAGETVAREGPEAWPRAIRAALGSGNTGGADGRRA